MNLWIVSLPLVLSASFLTSSLIMLLALREGFSVKVPVSPLERVDERDIIEGFSKVFVQVEEKVEEASYPVQETEVGNISLVGLSRGFKNMALLKVKGKPVIIEEGETKRGITLKKVTEDSAVLDVGGRIVTVKLKKPELSSFSGSKKTVTRTREFRISRREIERITRDPGIMFREIRLVPYVKNGRTEGFIFEWIKPGSLLHRAGLRKGDVLVSINNMTITSGEDAFRILQMLRNEPSLKIVILRRGRREEINVRIE